MSVLLEISASQSVSDPGTRSVLLEISVSQCGGLQNLVFVDVEHPTPPIILS